MAITGLDMAVLGVESVDDAARFLSDFQLEAMEVGAAGASFLTLDGAEVRLRSAGETDLPEAVSSGSTVREMIWGVADEADLQAIAAELERDRRVTRGNDGVLRSTDDDGYGVGFRVTQRRPFTPGAQTLNIFGGESRRAPNTRMDFASPVTPATIGHVVVFTADVQRAMRFYVERLNFRVSDYFAGGQGAFLRAAGSSDHHTLFLIRHPEGQRGLHHLSFHVTDFNEVMMGGKRLTERGWKTKFGPGRHVIGSNCFWYFETPCGGAMELAADMDHADDGWQAREWNFAPENVAAWSTTFGVRG